MSSGYPTGVLRLLLWDHEPTETGSVEKIGPLVSGSATQYSPLMTGYRRAARPS